MKLIHPSRYITKFCAVCGNTGVRMYHSFAYWHLRRRFANFKNPKDISEHILSSMQKPEFLEYAKYADKVKVRDYIISKGLGDHLLKIYGIWKDANEIDFNKLPEKFALKPNNGSGGHIFCHDKSKIDIPTVREKLNKALILEDIAYKWEPHYSKIEPKIFAEELIETPNGILPIDYKFTCIKGKIADCFICSERDDNTSSAKYITLDTDWNILPYTFEKYLPKKVPQKPKHLAMMIDIAKLLSADFECVRVDLYEYKDKVYFGELTFSPWGGIMYSYNDYGISEMGKLFE